MSLYKEKLNRIFFDNPPAFLYEVPEVLISNAFALQGIEGYVWGGPYPDKILQLNFIRFIHDLIQLDKKRKKVKPPKLEIRLRASGILYRSMVNEWKDDIEISILQKFYRCFFYRKLLFTLFSLNRKGTIIYVTFV